MNNDKNNRTNRQTDTSLGMISFILSFAIYHTRSTVLFVGRFLNNAIGLTGKHNISLRTFKLNFNGLTPLVSEPFSVI